MIFGVLPALYAQTADTKVPAFGALLGREVRLRSELRGVHPRLFFSAADLREMRRRARGGDRALWQSVLADLQTLRREAPDPRDEDLYKSGLDRRRPGSISQYEFAFQIAQTSFAYAIEGDEKYLAAAKKWVFAACAMPLWGYTYNKPNVDLPPAHLLYALAFAYDVLHERLTPAEKAVVREKLIKQARLMYEYFKYKPGKRYTYTQNHTWIPMAGLAIAAYALMDETEEAHEWARLARAVYERTMDAFGTDGFFYESFHYFGFAFRWMVRYFDAHRQATGENLYLRMEPKFRPMKYFAMHTILPDRENVFDIADIGDGALNRNKISKREKIYGEDDILSRFAAVYRDGEAQTVADFMREETALGTREPMWRFINRDASVRPAPLARLPRHVHFADHDTAFWRSDWSRAATAFAFRCGPPEGHHAARLAGLVPDWRQNTGHAHPDANSFIIYAGNRYLTGDTGYLGIKETDDHNTILVNGRGQERDGRYEMFKDVANERLDRVRIAETWANAQYFYARGEAAAGYDGEAGLEKFDRHFIYVAPDYFVVRDELRTREPASFTFLLNADRDIEIDGATAELVNQEASLRVVRVAPRAASSSVVPQIVEARGLPGSVDKGVKEQRGVQLRTAATAPARDFEFLHFLQPGAAGAKTPRPQVTAFGDGASGFRLDWPDGDAEYVWLDGRGENLDTDAARVILREDARGAWRRLIWQHGSRLAWRGRPWFESERAVSASFQLPTKRALRGFIKAEFPTLIKLVIPIRPRLVTIGGRPAKFEFDRARRLIVQIPAGEHALEIA